MRFADIRSALIQSWLDGGFELDTAYPNKKFDPAAGTPWAAVFILPNQPEVATLGKNGEDVHDGVFQISLFYPPDEGDADIMAKADAVAAHYKAGNRYTYDSQGVLIRSCGRSQGRLDDGWYRIDLTVNWQSHVSRAAPAPSCTISLAAPGAVGVALGWQPLDLSGQTLSKTLSSSTTNTFSGGTPDGETITIDWSGRRTIEFGNNDAVDFGLVERGLVLADLSALINWKWDSGNLHWQITYGGANQLQVSGSATDVVALVVDGSTGDVEFWKNGTLHDTDTATFASGDQVLFYKAGNTTNVSIPSGASATTTVRTAGGDMAYSYNGANDWCGNAI